MEREEIDKNKSHKQMKWIDTDYELTWKCQV